MPGISPPKAPPSPAIAFGAAPGAPALGAEGVRRTTTSMATRKNMHIMMMLYMNMSTGVFATSARRAMGYNSSGLSVKYSSMSSMKPLWARCRERMVMTVRTPR